MLRTYFTFIFGIVFSSFAVAKVNLPIEHWETENGTKVYFMATPNVPIIDIVAAFHAGSAYDDIPGTAALVNNLLLDGTETVSADEVAEQLANTGAIINNYANRDSAGLSLRVINQADIVDTTLPLFVSLLKQPSFKEADVARKKTATLNVLKYHTQNPGIVANNLFYKTVFADHPYAHPVLGTVESLEQLNPELLKQFHQHHYVANNMVLAITGNLTRTEVETLANTISQTLPIGDLHKLVPVEQKPLPAKNIHQSFPSNQTHLIIGQLGITHNSPDYIPLSVANYILGSGGNMKSLLFQTIRKDNGLAYNVRSHLSTMAISGTFSITLQTENQQVQQADKLAKTTLEQFIARGPTEAELNAAKLYLTGSFPLNFTSNAAIVSQLSALGIYELPLDYFDQFLMQVKATTPEQIKTALQKHIVPESMITVTVGNDQTKE